MMNQDNIQLPSFGVMASQEKQASLGISQALEKAKSLAESGKLSQDDYQTILNQMDSRDQYPFSMALLEHGLSVKTGAVNIVDKPETEYHDELSWPGRYPESEEQQEQSGQNDHDSTHLDRHSQLVNELVSAFEDREEIPNGVAKGIPDEEFDPEQLAKGVEVEMEHTKDPEIAGQIARDHLNESPEYYLKLEEMEREMKKANNPQTAPAQDAIKFQTSNRRVEGDRVFVIVTWHPEDVHGMSARSLKERVKSFVKQEINEKNLGFSGGMKVEEFKLNDGTAEVSYKSSEDAAPQYAPAHSAPLTVTMKEALKQAQTDDVHRACVLLENILSHGAASVAQAEDLLKSSNLSGIFTSKFQEIRKAMEEGNIDKASELGIKLSKQIWADYQTIKQAQGGFEPGTIGRGDKEFFPNEAEQMNEAYKNENAFEDKDLKLGDIEKECYSYVPQWRVDEFIEQNRLPSDMAQAFKLYLKYDKQLGPYIFDWDQQTGGARVMASKENDEEVSMKEATEPYSTMGPMNPVKGEDDPKVNIYTPQAITQLSKDH